MSNEKEKLTDQELEGVVGGGVAVSYPPGDDILEIMGLSHYAWVKSCFILCKDAYYYTRRSDGSLKEVGSGDMLNYIGSVKGWASEEYNALKCFCDTGECWYQGRHIEAQQKC